MQNDQNLTSTPIGNQPMSQSVSGPKSQLLNSYRSNLFTGASASSDQSNTSLPPKPQPTTSIPPQPQQALDQNIVQDLDLLEEVMSEVESQSPARSQSQSQSQPQHLLQPEPQPTSQSQALNPQLLNQQPVAQSPQPQSQPHLQEPQAIQPQPQIQELQALQSQPLQSSQPLQPQPTPQLQASTTHQPVPPQPTQDTSILSQALPVAVAQVADQQAYQNLNPPSPAPAGFTGKEKIELRTPDSVVVDANSGIQLVEQEPNPELPPEVDGFLKKAENQQQQNLQEIIIADGSNDLSQQKHYPSQPVVVLPITEETEKNARFKGPKYSIKWLVEWSHKMIKKFVGKVIYRQV